MTMTSSSTLAWKITKDSIQPLSFSESDFDAITLQLPSGLYTTFRTYAQGTKVIGLRAHLARLYEPTKKIKVVRTQEELRRVMAQFLEANVSGEARVRLILDTTKEKGILYLLIQPLQTLPKEIYLHGIRVATIIKSRNNPTLKSTKFISESSDERAHKQKNIFELLLTHNGAILEGMTSNFFYISDGKIFTASRGILNGVTRRTVIRLAKELGMQVIYRALKLKDVPSIHEAFITSSSRGVVPVIKIDGQRVGEGMVGDTTRKLNVEYDAEVLSLAEAIGVKSSPRRTLK